jgi:hypothetical protein
MGVTIQHFELRLDVDAGEEELAFARLFEKFYSAASRRQREQQEADEATERDSALGDRIA